jgi:hypothetical protein
MRIEERGGGGGREIVDVDVDVEKNDVGFKRYTL